MSGNDSVPRIASKPGAHFLTSIRSIRPDASAEANVNRPKHYLVGRNVTVRGHRTSVRLEPEMWAGLTDICRREGLHYHELVSRVAEKLGPQQSLTSAIRVFIMVYYRVASTEEGHAKAGHPSHRVG